MLKLRNCWPELAVITIVALVAFAIFAQPARGDCPPGVACPTSRPMVGRMFVRQRTVTRFSADVPAPATTPPGTPVAPQKLPVGPVAPVPCQAPPVMLQTPEPPPAFPLLHAAAQSMRERHAARVERRHEVAVGFVHVAAAPLVALAGKVKTVFRFGLRCP